jgi:hypothetical protein
MKKADLILPLFNLSIAAVLLYNAYNTYHAVKDRGFTILCEDRYVLVISEQLKALHGWVATSDNTLYDVVQDLSIWTGDSGTWIHQGQVAKPGFSPPLSRACHKLIQQSAQQVFRDPHSAWLVLPPASETH